MSAPDSKTPTLTPESDGFWWLWHEGEWCPALLKYYAQWGAVPEFFDVTMTSGEGARIEKIMHTKHVSSHTWGGRITPPEGLE